MRNALVASLLLVAVGCGTSAPGADDGVNDDGGSPENPVPAKTGPYQVQTRIDFTIEAILPPQIEVAVVALRLFSTNPARAIFDLAEQKGVPAVGIIRDVLPGALEDRLEGWINDEIAKLKINGKPITAYVGEVAALAEIALSEFAVDSELTMDGETATHRLTALDLSPAGIDFRLPIGGLPGDILTQSPVITVFEGGALGFGDQHFGLAYGEYAWQGLEQVSTTVFGQGIRASLGKAIDCTALANTIGDKCALGACVGHKTELRAICTGGLDALVDFSHDRFAAMRLDALHFATGAARLVDDDGDGYGDQIADGVWQAELNIGLGLRHAPATFAGVR
ncbi:MAG: hypothetical protein H0X17_10525 [Deltaproteobacteria bacterium]|nr:hypothetical protein [Deltaproteobacteria bacterium]